MEAAYVVMTYDPLNPGLYNEGQVVIYNNAVYVVGKDIPTGLPESSSDFTLILDSSSTTVYDSSKTANYVPGQIVIHDGVPYIVENAEPVGIPGSSDSYSPFITSITGPTGATGVGIAGPTGATGSTGATGADGSNYKFSVNPGYLAGGDGQYVSNNEAIYFSTRTPEKLKVTIEKADPSGVAVWLDAVSAGSTGAPIALPAAQYAMRTGGDKYGENVLLPYQTLIQQPDDGSIQMDDRTVVVKNSGNYQVNFSVTSNGTTGVPNIHIIVDDSGGTNGAARHRDIDVINVLNQGMTSSSLIFPLTGPGRIALQVQGRETPSFSTPPNPPQGQLSIIKIA